MIESIIFELLSKPVSIQETSANCGTLQEIVNQVPIFADEDLLGGVMLDITYAIEKTRTISTNKFVVNFYKVNRSNAIDQSVSPRDWINKREFDVALIYEVDENGNQKESPIGVAYLRGQLMPSLFSLSRNTDDFVHSNPGKPYFEKNYCAPIIGNDVYSALLDTLKAISITRLPLKKTESFKKGIG